MATQDFSLQQLQPFLEGNPERGVLRVQVSTALGAFPVNRALVEVAVMLGGGRVPLYRRRTMANYVVSVSHPSYETVTDLPVGVFIGTKTILPVVLTPATK